MAGHFFCARNQGSLLAVLLTGGDKHEVRHAAEVDRRSSICRRISIIVDRRWSALSQAHRDWPDVYADVSKHDGPRASGENRMGRTLAGFVVAASLLTLASSEAAAWVCRAVGLGSSGYARAYDIIDAKLFALRQCERRRPLPICTLVGCHPGGSRTISSAPLTDMPRR
jgi:hypothetical protein